jgi:hypothetical protein
MQSMTWRVVVREMTPNGRILLMEVVIYAEKRAFID